MPRNKLTDLNNVLFLQLERLDDEDLTKQELHIERERASAISSISKCIINNAKLTLDAAKFKMSLIDEDDQPQLPNQFKE